MPHPQNPLTAATHPDPYPFYAELTAQTPLYFDTNIGCWVASSAETVTAVLSSEYCRVRPPSEPVPKHLSGSPAAAIFGSLMRMTDGDRHDSLKPPASAALAGLESSGVGEKTAAVAQLLFAEVQPHEYPERLAAFNFRLPVYVVGSLLGIPTDRLADTARWIGDFTGGLAPDSTPERIERCSAAAENLLRLFHTLLAEPDSAPTLLTAFHGHAINADAVAANGIGFLMQAYEATAGLIGNTLAALAANSDLRERICLYPCLLPLTLQEVLRCDPSVQNTRRYAAQDCIIAGQAMRAGDMILIILAAANRDPAANPDPHTFDIHRQNRRIFTFGVGAHACVGETLAVTIAAAAVETLLAAGLDIFRCCATVCYRPSANTRIPLFGTGETGVP